MWLFSGCGSGASHCGASLVAVHGLSSCSIWVWLPQGTWDLPGPELKPVSPALAGRFLTTGPPGKSLGAAHFKDFDKCIMTHIHHCRIIQNSFSALKMPCVLPIHSSPPPAPGNHRSSCLHGFAFPKISYSWNHMVCSLSRLTTFT